MKSEHKSLKSRNAYPRKLAKHVLNETFEELRINREVVRCKAEQAFTKGKVEVQEGERFFLVRSESLKDQHRYYAVKWDDERLVWTCSCWKGSRPHNHTQKASEHAYALASKQKTQPAQVVVDPLKKLVAEKVAECVQAQAAPVNEHQPPRTAQEWKEALARQRQADIAHHRKYHQAAREIAAASQQIA